MKKGILINPYTETLEFVEIDTWRDIAPLLDARLFDVVNINEKNDMYVDDEGMLSLEKTTKFVAIPSQSLVLAGKCLVLGVNEDGESLDTTMSIEEMKNIIKFFDIKEAYQFSVEHDI